MTLAFDSLHYLRSETATLHNNAQLLVALRASSSPTTPLFSEVSVLALLRGFSGGKDVNGWKGGSGVVWWSMTF